jgi:membrane-associated phospholipid phosphatase
LPADLSARRALVAAVGCLAVFAVLSVLVVTGKLQWLDQYAVDHWMPGFKPTVAGGLDSRGLVRPFPLAADTWQRVLDVWAYPASFVVTGLATGVACVVLWRRRHFTAAAIWAAAWLAANAIDYVGKRELERPALHWREHGAQVAISTFHNTFPSGHTIRALFVVALVFFFARRFVVPAILWFLLVPPFLVISAGHTPSDVIGGFFAGLALVLLVAAALSSRRAREEAVR